MGITLYPRSWLRSLWCRARDAREIAAAPLHSGSRLKAIRRYERMRRAGRLGGAYPVIRYVEDAVLAWPEGASSVGIQAKFGLGELRDQAFCLHLLRPEDLFCDAGANAGVYTILASKVVGARAVAFEPVPKTFSLLMQNVWANDVAGLVDANQCGLGREEASLHFTADLWSFNHVVAQPGSNTVEVPVRPLDVALTGRVPRFLKIDVEGFEGEVIAGARQTLADPGCAAVVMELVNKTRMEGGLNNFGTDRSSLIETMRGLGFESFWYDPFARSLTQVGSQGPREHNVVFVKDVAFVRDRISSARKYDVHGSLI